MGIFNIVKSTFLYKLIHILKQNYTQKFKGKFEEFDKVILKIFIQI